MASRKADKASGADKGPTPINSAKKGTNPESLFGGGEARRDRTNPQFKALFFSVGNLKCGMVECGKGRKEWVRVGKNGIFFKCGKGGEGVGESW